MRTLLALAIAVGVLGALSISAHATDALIPGKILIVKPGTLAKVVAKGTFTLPSGGDNPTVAGGSLEIRDLGDMFNDDTYSLPSGGWKGLGNPPGSNGYKYKGAGTVSDPCKVALIKTNIVKAVCRGAGVTLTTPVSSQPVAVKLSSGTGASYCAGFGGTEVKNTATILKRKDAPAPGDCFSPSGAFVDDSSGLF
jgi:hypothetical protein